MRFFWKRSCKNWFTILVLLVTSISHAQQFNSDSWLSKPHGMATLIPTFGQRNLMLMNTYSLFPNWEFTMAAYIYNNDGDPVTDDGYSTTFYVKYMFKENEAKTGGAAIKFGTGMFPGTLDGEDRVKDAFKTYWFNVPITVPLFDNKLSWDLMPGGMLSMNYGAPGDESDATALTYSTRLAWYAFKSKPGLAIVGEVFGAHGEAEAIPEYKIGLRLDTGPHATYALTYGHEFNGKHGAGIEFGIMLFTPQFACFKGCKK
jgi:hypothetical protein